MNENKSMFIKILSSYMKSYNLTQKKLAQAIGVNHTAISDFLNGVTLPSFTTLIALADYFNVSTDYLTGRTDKPEINR